MPSSVSPSPVIARDGAFAEPSDVTFTVAAATFAVLVALPKVSWLTFVGMVVVAEMGQTVMQTEPRQNFVEDAEELHVLVAPVKTPELVALAVVRFVMAEFEALMVG